MALSKSEQRQFGEMMNASFGDDALAITAGAGQDGLENDGDFVAIPDAGGKKRPESATPVLVFTTDLDDTETLTLLAQNGQDASSAAGAGVADFDLGHSVTSSVLLATGLSGGTTVKGAHRGPTLNLVGANTHIRFQYTVDLSRAVTDTVNIQLMIVWGGYGLEPTDAVVEDSNA